MVVSVFDIMHRGNDYEEWKDFIEKFDEVYGKDKEKWEKGRIILDVRGNRGGEDKPIDHMAKRLYGNLVNTYKRCEVKDSSLGYHLYQQHGSVKNAKKFNIPVIGLTKPDKLPENWKSVVYITPGLKEVRELIDADADVIAFDGTQRQRPDGSNLKGIIDLIHSANKLAMADISTYEEGINAANLGADIISTTLAGYTIESENSLDTPDFDLLEKLVKNINKPIFLEGRVWYPEEVKKAFQLGAHAVVIGSAITRPHLITKRFIEVL